MFSFSVCKFNVIIVSLSVCKFNVIYLSLSVCKLNVNSVSLSVFRFNVIIRAIEFEMIMTDIFHGYMN